MKIKSEVRLGCFGVVFFSLLMAMRAVAGTFSCDFNSGFPANSKVYGDSMVADAGGVKGSGVLKLTLAKSNQAGSFAIDPLDDTNAVTGFTATFKALMNGGRGGDGFSFCFAPDLTNGLINELGDGSGLIVIFDTYKNSVDKMAPAIRVYWQKNLIEETAVDLRMQRFAEVFVQMRSDGTFNLGYDGNSVFTNLTLGLLNTSGRFAFGSRTGGAFDNHWIDDLNIQTETGTPPFIEAVFPTDDNAAPDAAVEVMLADWGKLNRASVRMKLDEMDVTPVDTTNSANFHVLQYQPQTLLEPGSSHVVYLAFEERGDAAVTRAFSFRFSVNSNIQLHK